MENLVIFWMCSFFIGLILCFIICMSDEVYILEDVLNDKKEAFRYLFQIQFTIYELLNEEIKNIGIWILIIIATFIFWHINILMFVLLLIGWLIKLVCILFYTIFKK